MTLFDVADGSSALLSECGRYRYTLTRSWDPDLPVLVWVMLNPSTANATENDPTIRKCIGFAKRWGYGGIVVVNLFAVRATDPRRLVTFDDPVGKGNPSHVLEAARGRTTIAAWGASVPQTYATHAELIVAMLRAHDVELYHLGLTKDGHPRHPLYLANSTTPTRWAA